MTDREFLKQYVTNGSEEAFEEIVTRYKNMVYGICLRVLGDSHDAEDAAQATLLTLAQKAGKLFQHTDLAGWLFRTAELTSRNVRKVRARRIHHEKKAESMHLKNHEEERELWGKVSPYLDELISSLPSGQRSAIVLRYLPGHDTG